MSKGEKIALSIILLVAAVVRIYGFSDFSLSNDELSAIARLNYDSFYDLIMQGVRIDGHPPAAQVILYYMTRMFVDSVFVVRFPFVLAGIASVYFVFRLAKEWISTSAALLVAALFATLAFPILYSRLARPYALGMLFVSMASFFWIRIVKKKEKPSDFVWLALSLALCGFSHYFAALVGAILSVTGFFLVGKTRLGKYALALVGGFILFAPYITVFLYQLNTGGVGQWLGPPENDWLLNHIYYAFNNSNLLFAFAVLLGVGGFAIRNSKKSFINHVLPLLLFLFPFLIGFFYSRWVNPVLQNSTLVFSFPFLLVFLFSGWENGKRLVAYIATAMLLSVTAYSTVVHGKFFKTNHFGVFKELAQHVTEWNKEVENDALLIGDYNSPFYIHYYLDRIEPIELDLYRTSDDEGSKNLKQAVSKSSDSYAIYSWSTINQSPEIQEIIRDQFHEEVKREAYFNSEAIMFKRSTRPKPDASFAFEKSKIWNLNPDKIEKDSVEGIRITVDSESPYGPTFQSELKELLDKGFSEIVTRIEFEGLGSETDVQIVYEQTNEEGGYAWESDKIGPQIISKDSDWAVCNYLIKPNENPGEIKVYPWSPKGEAFTISKMEVWFR